MPRLYIFAEGKTELTYADTVLKPHLANFQVYVEGPILIAHAESGDEFIAAADANICRCGKTFCASRPRKETVIHFSLR